MALIACGECGREVSDKAPTCPQCGGPIAAAAAPAAPPQFRGPPHDCRHCGGALHKGREATSEGSGCLIALVGLLLTPFLIGIPIILYGVHLMSKREGFWRCGKCDAKFPRQIGTWEFG